VKKIFLSPPHMSGEELAYIEEAFRTNWIAPVGPHVDAFEREIAEYTGARGAVALSSGTAAIHLALRLLGVGPGDLVFCSSLTFIGSVSPITYLGATPVFIDSEPSSWNMSSLALERAMADSARSGKLPKAVIAVNLYGQSADLDPILEVCNEYNIPVIEDAAESLGATYKGRQSGTIGKFGIYSFNGNKIITTSGGGMLVSDDEEALKKAKYWATQAREPAAHYEHVEIGYNYRLSNLLAGVGRAQLKVLDQRIEARRAVFERYKEALGHLEGIEFMPEAPFGRSTRWLTALTIDPEVYRKPISDIVKQLDNHNIETRPVWKPMHLQPVFAGCKFYPHEEGRSVSDRLFVNGICLPSGSNLIPADQDRVIERFIDVLNS